jgi:hypothetical protein
MVLSRDFFLEGRFQIGKLKGKSSCLDFLRRDRMIIDMYLVDKSSITETTIIYKTVLFIRIVGYFLDVRV